MKNRLLQKIKNLLKFRKGEYSVFLILQKVLKGLWRKRYKAITFSIAGILLLFLLPKIPTIFVRGISETFKSEEANSLNTWENVGPESLGESDTSYASTTLPSSTLAVNLSDPTNCKYEIDSLIVNVLAYSATSEQTIVFGIDNETLSEEEEPNHEEGTFSHHLIEYKKKQDEKPWTCEDLNDLVLTIQSISEQEEGDWKVDKVWIEVQYTTDQPIINQRSYRWQYDTSKVPEAIKPDSSLKKVEVGEKVALRIQLDNTGKFDSVDETYLLQYATKAGPSCEKDQVWNDVTDTTPISYSKVSKDEITTPATDTSISCGNGNCTDYVASNWATEESQTSIPSNHFTEIGFTLDTLNASEETSYCLRVVTQDAEELNGQYVSFPEINFGKKDTVAFKKELKALKEPKIRAGKKDYLANELPHFELEYFELTDVTEPYTQGIIEETRMLEGEKFKIIAEISDFRGEKTEIDPKIVFAPDGHTYIELPPQTKLRPGRYTLKLEVEEKDYATFSVEQDFTWGVLAINTNKATYLQGEEVKFLMTVLDDGGHTYCDADILLQVTTPNGSSANFSTEEGTIQRSLTCAPNNYTYIPDFSAQFTNTSEIGEYILEFTAVTPDGERSLTDKFRVEKEVEFDIERIGPVRIYPYEEPYEMRMRIKPNVDFTGEVTEIVPASFEISIEGEQQIANSEQRITWSVDWKAGETYELSYTFDAPDVSPEFYLLGPLEIGSFKEARRWQIASDGPGDLILFWDTTIDSIPGDWTAISGSGGAYENKFIRGAETAGGTGGFTEHTHSVTPTVSEVATDRKGNVNPADLSTLHNHTATTGGLNASNIPQYRTLVLIRYSGIPETLPYNIIVPFDTDPGGDWVRYVTQDGDYIYGSGTAGSTGGNVNYQHTHTITLGLNAETSVPVKRGNNPGSSGALSGHTHTVANQSAGPTAYEPAYHNILLYRNNNASGVSIPADMLGFFDAAAPTNWSSISGSGGDFENKFLKPASGYSGTGGGSGHSHSDITGFYSNGPSTTCTDCTEDAGANAANASHIHQIDLTGFSTTTEAENDPPYVNTVIAKYTPPIIDISGKIYQTNESTHIGNPPCDNSTPVVSVRVDGGDPTSTTCTDGGGGPDYTFSSINASAGSTITIYLNDSSTPKANLVVVSGAANITGADLYQNRIIVRDEQDGTIVNADLADWDNDDDGPNMLFDADSNTLDTDPSTELHVWTGDEYEPEGSVTLSGSYHNDGTADWGTNTITATFDSTSSGEFLKGTLSGASALYKVNFNGSGGEWTIQDAMEVTAANAADTFLVTQGTVTLGDGDNDDLEIDGKMVVGSASGTATFQTMDNLAQGSEIIIDVNDNAAPPACANCIIAVGTSTDSDPQGTFTLNENALLRFNSNSSIESGLEVLASGKLNITGDQDDTGTATDTDTNALRETKICADDTWGNDDHNDKHVRISNTSSLAHGRIFTINDTIQSDTDCSNDGHDSLTITDDFSGDDTGGSYNSTTKVYTSGTSLISSNDDAIGQYLYNESQGVRSRIVDSTENGAADTLTVANTPDTFVHTGGNTVRITEGILTNDTFEILDYATVTAQAGTGCNDIQNGYIYGQAQSEVNIQYADVCDLGANDGNHYGVWLDSINAANANEGARVDSSRFKSCYTAIGLGGCTSNTSTNSAGITDNSSESNENQGIYIGYLSKDNTISGNVSYKNTSSGIHMDNGGNNLFTYNTLYLNGIHGLYLGNQSQNNIISYNSIFSNNNSGIYFYGSSENIVQSNKIYKNGNNNVFQGNASPIGDHGHIFLSNSNFDAPAGYDGISSNITGRHYLIGDQLGVLGENEGYDVSTESTTITFTLYDTTLASTDQATSNSNNSYIISRKHNSTDGLTRVWDNYTVPDDVAGTPNNEGNVKFNYANNLWGDSAIDPGYYGSGTQDTDIQITLTSPLLEVEWYRAVVTTANGDTPIFTITRSGGAASPSTYTLPGTYTESVTGVQFTIEDGAVNYELGDTYTFVVIPDSNDADTQKTITMMQEGDVFTVGTGETVELKGQSSGTNETTITRGGSGTDGFSFDIAGTIDAQYYTFSYLKGPTDGLGLDLQSTATVTNLADGTYNNYQDVIGTDSYIRVHSSIIGDGSPTKNFANVTFTENGDGLPEYTLTESGGSPGTGYWLFSNATTCTGWSSCEDSDNDSGDNGTNGYIRFPTILTGTVYTDEGVNPIGANRTIRWALNGVTKNSDDTDDNGVYSISTLETINSGDILTFYIDDEDGDEATMVTETDGSTFTGLHLYEDRVIARADAGSLSTADFTTGDDGDEDVHYEIFLGSLIVEGAFEFHIWTGDSFIPGTDVYILGDYDNNGTVDWGTDQALFQSTTTGRYLEGAMTGGSAFYQVSFYTTGSGEWTIQDSMEVTGNIPVAFNVMDGSVTLGNGSGDNLEVDGEFMITSDGTFETMDNLPQGDSITIDINDNASPTDCSNCYINMQGVMTINENATLRFNSFSSVQSGVIVNAQGELNITGERYPAAGDFTSTSGTDEGTGTNYLYVGNQGWTDDQFNNMTARMTSGLALGRVYDITDTFNNSGDNYISFSGTAGTTDTNPTVSGSNNWRRFTTSIDLITSNDQDIGRYLHDIDQGKWFLIADTVNVGASADTIDVIADPDDFTGVATGDDIEIVDGIKVGDTFEILDYANVTAHSTNHGYIYGVPGSEVTISSADISQLGAAIGDKYGITTKADSTAADTIFTLDKSVVHDGYCGVRADTNSRAATISNSSFYNFANATDYTGIDLAVGELHEVYNNRVYSNDRGITVGTNSYGARVYGNYFYDNILGVYGPAANGPLIYNNQVYLSTSADGNVFPQNADAVISHNNKIFAATGPGLYLTDLTQIVSNNEIFFNNGNGIRTWNNGAGTTFFGNTSYKNGNYGLVLRGDGGCDIVAYDENYGGDGANPTADITTEGNTQTLQMFASTLGSSTEVTGVTDTGDYIISRQHDQTTGVTEIWGEYTIPDDVSETPNNEGSARFNYAQNLWPDSATQHVFAGTGTEDTNIGITLTSPLTQAEWYRATLTTVAANGGTFTIYRSSSSNSDLTANPSTYDITSGTYTETNTGVQFTIEDGAVDHAMGATYVFVVFPDSNDASNQKTITMMQEGDIFTVGTGETVELKGQSSGSNETTISRGGAGTDGYSFDITGTIDAQYYTFSYLKGPTDGYGLDLQTGATVTNLADGTYNNYQDVIGTDSYIRVHSSIIGDGSPTKEFANVTFTENGDGLPEYTLTESGGSPGTGYWLFSTATCTGWASCEDSDNDSGNYIRFDTANQPPDDPYDLEQRKDDGITVIAAGDWTNETTVEFWAKASDPDSSDTLYLCIEYKALGVAFDETESCDDVGFTYLGEEYIVIWHDISGLSPGTEYHWRARVKDAASAYSGWVVFNVADQNLRDVGIDNTGPSSGTVNDGSTFGSDIDENDGTLDQVDANWTSIDDAQSGLNQFEYAIGTTAGGTDIVSWTTKADSGGTHADSFETGNLTAWDVTSIDVDDLYATYDSDAEYMGLYGLGANIDDTNSIYVQDNFVAAGNFYARFYLNPNSLTMASGDSFTLVDVRSTATIRASVELYYDGANHQVRGVLKTGPQQTSWVTISSNSYTAIELRWFADASGYVSLWVNGSKYDTATGDTSSTTVNNIQMGMVGAITAVGTSGEFFFDQFRSNSSYNAPFASFSESITTAGHLHTGQDYFVSVRARNNAETTAGTTNSDGFVVLPTFTFTVVPSSINLDELSPSNSWTDDTKFSTTTASTNAYHGYITTIWTDDELTHTANPAYSIQSYSAPNSAPTVWSGTGFGYTTTDYNLSGDGAADRFDPGGGDPKYAGFVLSGEGEPCADHTALIHGQNGPLLNDVFTITYRVTVTSAQEAGPYETDIVYVATPTF